jgi:hypothetical protein
MEQPRFDAPRPGMAMTHELGARPWQTPARLTSTDEVVQDYLLRMQDDSFVKQLVGVLESGVPVTTLANTIQLAGVMEGRHSIDTGMLVIPVLMEMMMLIGDKAGIKYNTGIDRDEGEETKDAMISSVLEELERDLDKDASGIAGEEEEQSTETENEPMGLMARRAG